MGNLITCSKGSCPVVSMSLSTGAVLITALRSTLPYCLLYLLTERWFDVEIVVSTLATLLSDDDPDECDGVGGHALMRLKASRKYRSGEQNVSWF